MSLRERAKKLEQRNPIMDGREKISIDEIIANFPNGVTLRECAILHDTATDSDYAVCVVDEAINNFFFGGVAFVTKINNLMEDFDSEDEFYTALEEEGLPIMIYKKRSKNGRIYTAVSIL